MSLKKAYLYLVSVISLIIWVVGAIMLLNMGLKTWVFKKADVSINYYAPCVESYDPSGKPLPCDARSQQQKNDAEKEARSAQRQRDAAQALAMIIIAVPVWWGHWRLAKREA